MSGQTAAETLKSGAAPEAEPVIHASGHRSLMRDAGRLITMGAGFGTLFVLLLSAKFAISAFLILCIAVVALGAMMWALGTVELRLIEIRDALGGRNRDGAAPAETRGGRLKVVPRD